MLEVLLLELEFVWPLLLLLSLPAPFVLFWASCFSRLSWRRWFRLWPGFLEWWQVGLVFLGYVVSLVASKYLFAVDLEPPNHSVVTLFQDTTQSVQKCHFPFRRGGILAYMNCSMIAWAATSNASLASFWSSSRKSNKLRVAGLKTSRWNLCLAIANDWRFTYFLHNTAMFFLKFPLLRLVMFLNVWRAPPRMREWN